VNCLYCGKDIGAFRLLRDSEFCSLPHRTSYKDRLGRVLTRIAESQAPPPPLAGFLIMMPPVPGNISSIVSSWLSTGSIYPVRTGVWWPVILNEDSAGEVEVEEQTPAACAAWMPAQPEPAERWIERSLAAPFAIAPATALPSMGGQAFSLTRPLAGVSAWASSPAAEPVARMVEPRTAGESACATAAGPVLSVVGQAASPASAAYGRFLQSF